MNYVNIVPQKQPVTFYLSHVAFTAIEAQADNG